MKDRQEKNQSLDKVLSGAQDFQRSKASKNNKRRNLHESRHHQNRQTVTIFHRPLYAKTKHVLQSCGLFLGQKAEKVRLQANTGETGNARRGL